MRELTDEDLADIVHGAHIRYNARLGDNAPDGPWDTLSADQKGMITDRVRRIRQGQGPEVIHGAWVSWMTERGWTLGEAKDPVKKTHPALRPYAELPAWQQAKDRLAIRIVYTFVLPEALEEIAYKDIRSNPADEMTRLTEGFPEAVVCVTHGHFAPCGEEDGKCVITDDPESVEAVYRSWLER